MFKNTGNRVVVIDAKRSPVSKVPGMLSQVSDINLLAAVYRGVSGGLGGHIDYAVAGSAFPPCRDNLCRKSVLAAGLSPQIGCSTVSKTCASSDEALAFAYMVISSGEFRLVLAGGCEKASNSPYILGFMKKRISDSMKMRLPNLCDLKDNSSEDEMHHISEVLAKRFGIDKEAQDSFAIGSKKKAALANAQGRFKNEIILIRDLSEDVNGCLEVDELVLQPFSEKDIYNAPPMFAQDGSLTEYNAAPMGDAAAGMLVMEYDFSREMALDYLVEIKDIMRICIDWDNMGLAMVKCVEKILNKNELSMDDIGLFEINEAFAVQAILTTDTLGLNINKINVNGGSLALGYPVGASGMRMCVTLIHQMIRTGIRYGLSVMCGGGLMATAILFESPGSKP